MFEIVFLVSSIAISFFACVIFEVIAFRIAKSNRNAREYSRSEELCDACGKNHKRPNSMLCKECEERAYGDTRDKDCY